MPESILTSVKAVCNLTDDNTDFDQEIIIHINAAFSTLHQLGVGPQDEQFKIVNKNATWEDFIGSHKNIEAVRHYVAMKTKLVIDAPTLTSFTINAYNEILKECEFRLLVAEEEVRNL